MVTKDFHFYTISFILSQKQKVFRLKVKVDTHHSMLKFLPVFLRGSAMENKSSFSHDHVSG